MAAAKTKSLPLILAALLLAGCTGRPLSEREIIRAVFFERSGSRSTACLLLEDKDAPEGQQGYKTAAAQGETPAQALQRAEELLEGAAYYGLMDVAALPRGTDWAGAQEIGGLLYEKAQPSPEVAVFALDGLTASAVAEQAGDLYDGMREAENAYGLHCGLQQLFARKGICTLPVWQEDGYGYLLLAEEGEPVHFTGPAAAQLAAVLCGQSHRMTFRFAGDAAAFRADARVTAEVEEKKTVVRLHLTNADFTLLTPALTDEAAARAALCEEWRQAFSALAAQPCDPLRLDFWAACLYGPGAKAPAPELEILFE